MSNPFERNEHQSDRDDPFSPDRQQPVASRPVTPTSSRPPNPAPSARLRSGTTTLGPTDARLLQARLRAAGSFLLVTQIAILGWRLLSSGEPLWPLHMAVILAIGASITALCTPGPFPTWLLRSLELTMFGLTAVFLATRQYDQVVRWAGRGDPATMVAIVKNTLTSTILLMLCYGMLIPNTWRSAARAVCIIAALPIITQVAVLVLHPEIRRLALEIASFERISENLVAVSIASGLSIFGAHVINTLRCEASEARQLNQYRLGRRLGLGGMGEVYLAEHQLLKRPCALKLIRPERASNMTTLARFEREVRAMARLSHPNIVEIFDYGRSDDGTLFYVMEYLRGRDLDVLIERHGPMPPGRVIYLLRQACDALSEAHAARLVHRDLKPANLFAARRGGKFDFVKILDFGLVKDIASELDPGLSREGTIRGTPMFIAPEQATADGPIDHRSDLYTIGGVAYYLLTGRGPFERETAARMIIAHARDPVEPPSKHNPNVPPDLERVVLRCLEKSPDDRFADAVSLARAFAGCEAASSWNDELAAQWWGEFEPHYTADEAFEDPADRGNSPGQSS
jgi:eukaryotic-like serine/threonine-protein kinase